MKKLAIFTIAALFALFAAGCKQKAAPKSEQNVNIAIQPSAAFIPLYIARYKGYIEEALKPMNVNVVWQDFESGPPMNQSLSAELSDIGVIGDVPTVRALSAGNTMKVVGIPASGADAYAMLSRADDKSFKSAANMKGKKIATVFGSTGHNFTTKLLDKYGLAFDDIEFISISAGEAQNALASGVCDAIVIWEPNVTRLVDSGAAKIVALGSETDLRGTNGFVVRSDYLADHRDIIKVILEQYYRAVSDIDSLDEQTLEKLSAALKITPKQTLKIAKKYNFSVSVSESDIASLQDTARFLVEIGNLDSAYNVSSKVENIFTAK
ncbi:MAG: aliphatic sulfonate ABC transporter substrate-binding protein [Treponema sp.]|nr:aliphatic sulfonate ABC transporter substrate-binding protein [Treponema sp.]